LLYCAETIHDVVSYCLDKGQQLSIKLGYIPLPDNVKTLVAKAAQNIQ
jgi:hypothetical protein